MRITPDNIIPTNETGRQIQRFRPLLSAGLIYLTISLLLRVVLWVAFGQDSGIGAAELAAILPFGILSDLVVLPVLLFPLTLVLIFLPSRRQSGRIGRSFAHGAALSFIFGCIYLAMVQYFFFAEFDSRFNLVAVDYLIYSHEVLINIWETYHVLWFLLAAGGLALLLHWLLSHLLVRSTRPPMRWRTRFSYAGLHLLVLLACLALFSTDTFALFNNRVSDEITANGISSLFRACYTNELNYDRYYRTLTDRQAFGRIRRQLASEGGTLRSEKYDDLARTFAANPEGLGKMNVVVVVEESFGAQFNGSYGDQRGLTPNFDRYAARGLLFSNAFATGTRTVRGLGALVTSLPPIPSEGIIKRPGSEHLANWGGVMAAQGYRTSFLYGGYGLFDNMNYFFRGNGFAIRDRQDIPNPRFTNIWGVSDGDLLDYALSYYDSLSDGHPFFSVIMTTSNHSPYTFPAGIPGIKPEGGGRLDGVRYADHALGDFLDRAADHAWFANTLFVIVADHDARVYGSAQIPLEHYRIPLLFLAPQRLAAKSWPGATSQMDVAPTVLGLLGLPYTAPFYGTDVLHEPARAIRPILVNHDHDVGLLAGHQLVVLGLRQAAATYRLDEVGEPLQPVETDQDLTDLATAYYQTAFELFSSGRYQ